VLHWEGYIRRMHTGRYLVPVWTTNFFTLIHFLGTLVAGTKGSVGIWYQSIEHITGSLGTRYQYQVPLLPITISVVDDNADSRKFLLSPHQQ